MGRQLAKLLNALELITVSSIMLEKLENSPDPWVQEHLRARALLDLLELQAVPPLGLQGMGLGRQSKAQLVASSRMAGTTGVVALVWVVCPSATGAARSARTEVARLAT